MADDEQLFNVLNQRSHVGSELADAVAALPGRQPMAAEVGGDPLQRALLDKGLQAFPDSAGCTQSVQQQYGPRALSAVFVPDHCLNADVEFSDQETFVLSTLRHRPSCRRPARNAKGLNALGDRN